MATGETRPPTPLKRKEEEEGHDPEQQGGGLVAEETEEAPAEWRSNGTERYGLKEDCLLDSSYSCSRGGGGGGAPLVKAGQQKPSEPDGESRDGGCENGGQQQQQHELIQNGCSLGLAASESTGETGAGAVVEPVATSVDDEGGEEGGDDDDDECEGGEASVKNAGRKQRRAEPDNSDDDVEDDNDDVNATKKPDRVEEKEKEEHHNVVVDVDAADTEAADGEQRSLSNDEEMEQDPFADATTGDLASVCPEEERDDEEEDDANKDDTSHRVEDTEDACGHSAAESSQLFLVSAPVGDESVKAPVSIFRDETNVTDKDEADEEEEEEQPSQEKELEEEEQSGPKGNESPNKEEGGEESEVDEGKGEEGAELDKCGAEEEEEEDEGETIEMEGEPQIAEHPFADGIQPALTESEPVDPFDPLSAPTGDVLSTDDHAVRLNKEEDKEEAEEEEKDGWAEGDIKPTTPEAIDEATSGFLDKVNSGTINSAQFMPAIVDLPEKVAKKKRPRKPKDVKKMPAAVIIPLVKKKRKRDTDDSSDESSSDGDAEYRPTSAKKGRRRQKSTIRTASARTTRGAGKVPRRTNVRRESLFSCRYCDFRTETIGELNIHTFGNHDSRTRPTFLDMAEATVAKMADRNGTSRAALLRAILADYGHVVEVNAQTARQILINSLRRGIELGRLRTGVPGKKGANSIFLPSKDERKILLQRFTINPVLLHVEDRLEPETKVESFSSIQAKLSTFNLEVTPAKKKVGRPRSTKNSGGRGRPAAVDKDDDDDICVVEEKLTPMARMKAKAYANAKAALAKKLPASLLRAGGGGPKMVRIGPGGIVRAEGGRIVTTIDPSPLLKNALGSSNNGRSVGRLAADKDEDDDDDDDLSCHLCLSSFWYRNELLEHLKSAHSLEESASRLKLLE